ncbi:MAG: hypothetical protein WAV00_18660, partial [Nocardioides sp.]
DGSTDPASSFAYWTSPFADTAATPTTGHDNTPEQSNEASDPNSTRTVPQGSRQGTWVEEVDLRPTMLHLLGLHDDYTSDGAVVSQVLAHPSASLRATARLAAAYRAINSSVGPLATATLEADSQALASGSTGHDRHYALTEAALRMIADQRDRLATAMKARLARAAAGLPLSRGGTWSLVSHSRHLLRAADRLR